jgi:hypothetical protein
MSLLLDVRRGHGLKVRLIRKIHKTEDMAHNIVDQHEDISGGSCPVPLRIDYHTSRHMRRSTYSRAKAAAAYAAMLASRSEATRAPWQGGRRKRLKELTRCWRGWLWLSRSQQQRG